MPSVRPASPKWEFTDLGAVADTALGSFRVFQGKGGAWYATLNEEPFPILYETVSLAQKSAEIVAMLDGLPSGIQLPWTPNTSGGTSAQSPVGDFHIIASRTITGFYVQKNDTLATVPMSSREQACEACAQYMTYVWFSLTETA